MNNICSLPILPKPGLRQSWYGLNPTAKAFAIANQLSDQITTSLIVTRDVASGERLKAELELFFAGRANRPKVCLFPDWETLPYDNFSPHQDIVSDRLRCLYALNVSNNMCVIVAAQTLMQRLVPTQYVTSKSLVVENKQILERSAFCDNLIESGYLRVDTVYQHGEFAVRGSLIDVFPMGSDAAFRIEFFDDEIESLRQFDPETQRTTEVVSQIELLPARECPLDDESLATFRSKWHARFDIDHKNCEIYQDINAGVPPAGIEYYSPLFFDEHANLIDYLPNTGIIFHDGDIEKVFEEHWREINHRYDSRCGDIKRPILSPEELFLPVNQLFSALKPFPRVILANEHQPSGRAGDIIFESDPAPLIAIDSHATQPLYRLENFIAETDKRILFCAESEGRREVIKEQLERIAVQPTTLNSVTDFLNGDTTIAIVVADIEHGINEPSHGFILINEAMLFGNRVKQARRRKKISEDHDNIFKNLTELKISAPVVHIEHGVGRYRGLQAIEHGGQSEEFLVLEYANEAKLYVPVANLHLISRYSGAEESLAPINKLGSEQWAKAKQKAAEKIRDVAAELLHIYAQRKAKKGFAHTVERDPYERFASEFPFEETPDQTTAISAVRADMLSAQPMDRLVCGDVGFGKTEVAMRATFIAIQNNKQVAVLVPTTLLAQQHYDNFKDRFANWPVNIDVISRFKTAKEIQSVTQKIEQGKLDIIIGTHKLLTGNMPFSSLGLVVIDEEHRFGVRQKEALKSIRSEVDILNLTATPIPRTLNMAMSGIRDLSIIATPPAKRLSVKTFVREHDDNLVQEAILREIMRGGQVYYLHNEVKSIEKVAKDIQALVPDARIRIGHGQMRERELEAVMSDFYHKRFNILVCTTIIETGIDVPSANTIIIHRADKFGLAQLHQLRGRVGRSHHQAYAYLLSPNKRNLTASAAKRLEAIEEAQELGAGFTLASHDLEIRGAGELLGEDQSGQMHTIGFTLYMEMLDRAVDAIKRGKSLDLEKPFTQETELNLRIPALIPEDYLPDVAIRLQLYKRLSSAKTYDGLEKLQVEMIDRFGLLPDALKNLFRLAKLRLEADDIGIAKIEASDNGGKIEFSSDTKVEPLAIVKLVQRQPQNYKLAGATHLQFTVETNDANSRLNLVSQLIETLKKAS